MKKLLLAASLALAVAAAAIAPVPPALSPIASAEAAVQNYAVAAGQVVVIPFHISGRSRPRSPASRSSTCRSRAT
jgi:hypothetical protein